MLVVGLTGSLATGKSTAAAMFKDFGAKLIDADRIVHQLLQKDRRCIEAVSQKFGKGILKGKAVDRRKLGLIVFHNEQKRKRLTDIIHPLVKREISRELKRYGKGGKNSVVVVEVPLLFEAGFQDLMDYTVVVKAPRREQIRRARKNLKITSQQAMQRIKAQMPLHRKIRMADIVIDNGLTKARTKKQVKEIWEKLQQKTRK